MSTIIYPGKIPQTRRNRPIGVSLLICFVALLQVNPILSNDLDWINEIYNNLKKTTGDFRSDWPQLKILGVPNKVASFNPKTNTIWVDQQAIDLAKSLGKNSEGAISWLIGHELTHFYQDHSVSELGFSGTFSNTVDRVDQGQEMEADLYGAFLSEQAGYRSISIVDSFLHILYNEYQILKSGSSRYPPIDDRISLAHQSCTLAANLVDIYQAANYALLIGLYEEAFHAYRYVSEYIRFSEGVQNEALALLMQYLAIHNNPLRFPFSIGTIIPISRSSISMTESAMLARSDSLFSIIPKYYDSEHISTRVGKLCTSTFLEGSSAVSDLKIVVKNKQEHSLIHITALNLLALAGQADAALDGYQQLLTNDGITEYTRELIEWNIATLTGQEKPKGSVYIERPEKQIDGIESLSQFDDYDQTIIIGDETRVQLSSQYHSVLLSFRSNGKPTIKLQRVFSRKVKTKGSIGIGSNLTEVIRAYPMAKIHQTSHEKGGYVMIATMGLVFKIDRSNVVTEWVSYSF